MRLFNNLAQPHIKNERSLKAEKPQEGEYVESTGLSQERGPRRLKKRAGPTNQPFVSEQEIRTKISKSSKLTNLAKAKQREMTKESSTFMAEKPNGDVGLNDPNSPVTVGKLKDLVSGGGFNFNDKEKSVLAEILKDR